MNKAATCLLGLCLWSGVVQAEYCPRYATSDRETVRELFSSHVLGDDYRGVKSLILRLSNIAYLCSVPRPLVALNLSTHRAAFENEYQAVKRELDELGTTPPVVIRSRTRAFLAEVLNTSFLGLAGTTVSGSTNEEALHNSEVALAAVNNAIEKLWTCL
jgi:hypothetical protein